MGSLVQPFVGRNDELSLLASGLRQSVLGDAQCTLIRGEAGIGKTALMRKFLSEVSRSGVTVCSGRWYENVAVRPHNAFLEAIECYSPDDVRRILRSLGQLGQPLRMLLLSGQQRPKVTTLDPLSLRFQVYEAFARAFSKLASSRTLCLSLDDIQHADAESISLFEYLVRHWHATKIRVLVAVRHTDLLPEHPLHNTVASLRHDGLIRELELGGLAADEVRKLIEHLTELPVAQEFADSMTRETGGNPLFVTELTKSLRESGFIDPDKAVAVALRPNDLRVPEGLSELIGMRLRRLAQPVQEALQTAALFGEHVEYAALKAMLNVEDDELLETLDTSIAAGILREAPIDQRMRLSFAHPLIRDAVYQQLGSARRRVMHARVAQVLLELHEKAPAKYAGELAYHLVRAEDLVDPALALRFSAEAGLQANLLCSYQEAHSHLRNAIRYYDIVGLDPRLRAEILTALGDVLATFGRSDESLDLYEQAGRIYQSSGESQMLATLQMKVGSTLNSFARFGEAMEILGQAIRGFAEIESGDHSAALAGYAIALMSSGRLNEAGPYIAKALDMAGKVGDPGYEAIAEHCAAIFNTWDFGESDEAALGFARSYKLATRVASPGFAGRISIDAALSLYILGLTKKALEALGAADGLAKTYNRSIEADVWAARMLVHVHRGEWDYADQAWHSYHERVGDATATAFDAVARRARALRLYWAGDVEGALEQVASSPPLFNASLRAWLLANLGRHDEARALCQVILSRLPVNGRGGLWLLFSLPVLASMRELKDVPDPAAWFTSLQRFTDWRTDWFLPSIELGELALYLGRTADALHFFECSIHRCESEGLKPFAAISRYRLAQALLVRKRPTDKRRACIQLEKATSEFDELGLRAYRDSATQLLGTVRRGRPPSQHTFGLTGRELQVLNLVAQGMSNPEISRVLTVSPKTVERHVSNIFSKIGVGDRTQAAVLAVQQALIDPQ